MLFYATKDFNFLVLMDKLWKGAPNKPGNTTKCTPMHPYPLLFLLDHCIKYIYVKFII